MLPRILFLTRIFDAPQNFNEKLKDNKYARAIFVLGIYLFHKAYISAIRSWKYCSRTSELRFCPQTNSHVHFRAKQMIGIHLREAPSLSIFKCGLSKAIL